MRRTKSLLNPIYHKKYREIYKLLFNADLDRINDRSNWMRTNLDYVEKNQPLWIIIESKILNKRMWITESFKDLEIATAQLDLDCKSNEYSKSYERFRFKNQSELCKKLEEILKPCLEKEQDLDLELDR